MDVTEMFTDENALRHDRSTTLCFALKVELICPLCGWGMSVKSYVNMKDGLWRELASLSPFNGGVKKLLDVI